jgi:dTDP-4-amino-4,6-dideoxygalactose transaminase
MIDSVVRVLESGKLNQWNNPAVGDFENEFARYVGCKHAVAVFNGTVALELCVKTLNLKEGDEVIVTPRTFIASASCCAWYGIKPIFVDVDAESQNITLQNIEVAITEKTKAVILVHLAGWPCDLDGICDYCREKGLYVIEDCAQAHGAAYKGKSVGTWGDVNAWSFCQDKIVTTGGEGGMVTTNDLDLYKKAWSLKDHGKGYDIVFNRSRPEGFRWQHERVGTNWRMTPMQAVIGIHALQELDSWVAHRRKIADIYNEGLKGIDGVRLTLPPPHVRHAYYKYYFFLEPGKFGLTRDEVIKLINKAGVFCQAGSCGEIFKEKALRKFAPTRQLPVAKALFTTSCLLLCDPCITEERALKCVRRIKKMLLDPAARN